MGGRLLALCLWLLPLLAGAQPGEAPALRLERLGLEHGLSQLSINALVEDDRGFLWIGTQEGLNRFDGLHFKVYRGASEGGELASSSVDALAFDRRSRLWIGTNDAGLDVFDLRDGSHRRLGREQGLSHATVAQILLDRDNAAWLGTETGIDRVDAEVTAPRPLGRTAAVVGMAQAGESGAFALDLQCRLWRLFSERIEAVAVDLPAGASCVGLRAVGEALWVATQRHGLHRLDPQGRSNRSLLPEQLQAGEVELSALGLEEAGPLLIGLGDGRVLQLDPATDTPAQAMRFDPAPGHAISVFHRHHSGVFWLGSVSNGLFRARPVSAAVVNERSTEVVPGLWPSTVIRSLWRDDRQWLVGTDAGLLRRIGNAGWKRVEAIPASSIRRIHPDATGGWWIGTYRGLWRLGDDGRASEISGLPDPRVVDLLVEGDSVWIATRGGLSRWRDGRIDAGDLPAALAGHFLTSLRRDARGRLWIGSNADGVFRLGADGALEQLSTSNGKLPHDSVWGLWGDAQSMWLGSFAGGLLRVDLGSDAVRRFDERNGLSNNVVYRIEPDPAGRLWLSTNNGLNVLEPASGRIQTLGPADGLRNMEYNSGASFADGQGRLLFGGTEGIDAIEPLRLESRSPAAQPVFAGLRVLGRRGEYNRQREAAIGYAERLDLDHQDSAFALDLAAMEFNAPGSARLRYRMSRLDADWVQSQGPQTTLSINYLPAGDYTLEVEAAGRDGRFGLPRRLQIVVQPPPWRSPTAYAIYALLVFGMAAGLVARLRAQMQGKRAQIAVLHATVAERTAELERANQRLLQSNRQLEQATRIDPLTRVSNRRELQDWLRRETALPPTEGAEAPRSLLFFMLDIDDFKRINDHYGHQAGDQVLVAFADRLREVCRSGDLLVRWGGEEFLLVARDTRREDAPLLAERLRHSVTRAPVLLPGGQALNVTCSLGFAPWPLSTAWPDLGDWEQSVRLADRALYAAKAAGKNAWHGVLPTAEVARAELISLLAGMPAESLRPGTVTVLRSDGAGSGLHG